MMPASIEPPARPFHAPRRTLADFGTVYAASGLIGFVFAASGPVAVILSVGQRGGLSETQLASWLFGCFFVNGLLTLAFSFFYRQPLAFFWTIPGTVLVGPALAHLSFPEVVGAYFVTGALMLALGLSGWVRPAMRAIPMPIVMGMVAGVFLRFGVDLVHALRDDALIALPMVATFLALSALPGLSRRVPPLLGTLAVGAVVLALSSRLAPGALEGSMLAWPSLVVPQWSWQAMAELVVPLAITVLVVQNGQGIAVLGAAGHAAPINAVATACGAGSLAGALTGTVSSCLTGPVNAILCASGDRTRQYTAGMFVGLLSIPFAFLAPAFTRLMLATPPAFIATLAGLAMLRVLQAAFGIAFKDRFTLGALVSFIVTVSDISILNIGAAFWGLVAGVLVSSLLEREDHRAARAKG